ncbi:MAG TPA: radical SAM protein [Solirubrobacteraceae bacterium]|nr:radical SAM protein [Solirubrobacteraceae bacterium]
MRWTQQSLDGDPQQPLPGYQDAVVRHFDAPEAIDTRFYEVRAKSILNRVPEVSQVPFRWTVNPYRGCTHACTYCFARPTHEFLDWNAGRDFEREIVVKVNAPERLRAELARPTWEGEHVALGTNTDPYQWVEGRYELMRGIWEAFLAARNPCSVLTKSPLLLRDLDLMRRLNEVTDFSAALSIPTLEPKAWRQTEPRTPNPQARLEALAELSAAGIRTGVLVAPLMPGINDSPEQVAEVVRLATEAGAAYVTGIALHLRKGVRDVFMSWLADNRPELAQLYEELYRRGAYAPLAERRRLAALIEGPQLSARQRDWPLQAAGGSSARFEKRRAERQSDKRDSAPAAPGEPSAPRLF